MFKLSNKVFYQRHKNEIEKFISNNESLHIINKNSRNKLNLSNCDQVDIDLDNEDYSSIRLNKKKYDTIILTDIIENQENLYKLMQSICLLLNDDGRLIISSINSKYNLLIFLLEKMGFKEGYCPESEQYHRTALSIPM